MGAPALCRLASVTHTLDSALGIGADTLGGSQPRCCEPCHDQCGCSSALKFIKNQPIPASNATSRAAAATGWNSSSLSQPLLTGHFPPLGADSPVPCGPGESPCGGPAMPLTYG
eukprot:scaffold18_cov111-Isochrysis_galbana.AAC.9